jgi:hypothetical protein
MANEEVTGNIDGEEGVLALGGNIELSGFSHLDRDTMIVLKKIVGNYAKKFSEECKGFQKLSLKMKPVHAIDKSEKYELHAMVLDGGKNFNSTYTDKNLFFAVDKVFKKIEAMADKGC